MLKFISSSLIAFASLASVSAEVPPNVVRAIEEHVCSNGWGALYYDVLPQVIEQNGYKKVAEIGVALGGHAEAILKNTSVENYYGIDPYLYGYDPNDGFSADVAKYSDEGGQKNFDYLYEWVDETRLKPYSPRYELVRLPSVLAAKLFADETFDCIFIDGDHRYEAVLQDLAAWYPKLKAGHLMVGDDYWMEPVARAVTEFFEKQGKEVFFFTSISGYKSWAILK